MSMISVEILKKNIPFFDTLKGTGNYNNVVDRMYYMFSEDDPQIIIFGHIHEPLNEEIEGVWFINPGSTSLNTS